MPFLSIPHGQNLNIFSPSYCLTASVYCTCVKLNSWNNWIHLTNRHIHLPERQSWNRPQSCKTILCVGVTHKTLHIQCVFTVHIIFSICIVCMYCLSLSLWMSLFGRWGVMAVFYRGSGLRTPVSVTQHNVPSEKKVHTVTSHQKCIIFIHSGGFYYPQGTSPIIITLNIKDWIRRLYLWVPFD